MPTATHDHSTLKVPRTLRHLDTDARWAERDATDQLRCTASEAASRLRGVSSLLCALGLTRDNIKEFMFLSDAVKDIALALERSVAAQLAKEDMESEAVEVVQ